VPVLLDILNNADLDGSQPALSVCAVESLHVLLQMIRTNDISQPVFLELVKLLERLMFREGITHKLFDVILEVFREKKVKELVYGVYRSEFDS